MIAKSGNVSVSKSCTHHCHSWHQGNIYIANFGHSWQLHGKSQIWKQNIIATFGNWKEPDLETYIHCHSWQLHGKSQIWKQNIIATFGNSWAHTIAIPGNSRMSHIWKQLHCHFWPFLATPWKEPDLATKHYSHFWEFLGTHHCHSW